MSGPRLERGEETMLRVPVLPCAKREIKMQPEAVNAMPTSALRAGTCDWVTHIAVSAHSLVEREKSTKKGGRR